MKFFKGKKSKQVIRDPQARPMDEIQKAYEQELSKAAQAQYLVFVHNKELEAINGRLLNLNQEASVRQALDKAVKEKDAAQIPEVKNEQA